MTDPRRRLSRNPRPSTSKQLLQFAWQPTPRRQCRLRRNLVSVNALRLSTFVITVLALGATACSHVAAYERARLAHPTMNPEDGSSAGLDHVRAVQEGATG